MRIVKIMAIFFAFLFSLFFLYILVTSLFSFMGFSGLNEVKFKKKYDSIHTIDIDVSAGQIEIKKGDSFDVLVSSSKNNIRVKYSNGDLEIEEKEGIFLPRNSKNIITIFVKEDAILEDLDISFGAGRLSLSKITSQSSSIEQGAGLLTITDSKFQGIDIEGGAGKISITDSLLNDLDLEAGAGSVVISSKVTGKSKIECGVGSISLELLGEKSDYRFLVEEGIGNIEIDGEGISSPMFGDGGDLLELKGGIGTIKVNFRKE